MILFKIPRNYSLTKSTRKKISIERFPRCRFLEKIFDQFDKSVTFITRQVGERNGRGKEGRER